MLMKYVIAGNKREYDVFIHTYKLKPEDHRYVFDPITVRGTVDPHGYFVGTWRDRDDIAEIVETMWLCIRTPNPEFDKILTEFRSHKREVY
jgi:hypothetical protein